MIKSKKMCISAKQIDQFDLVVGVTLDLSIEVVNKSKIEGSKAKTICLCWSINFCTKFDFSTHCISPEIVSKIILWQKIFSFTAVKDYPNK